MSIYANDVDKLAKNVYSFEYTFPTPVYYVNICPSVEYTFITSCFAVLQASLGLIFIYCYNFVVIQLKCVLYIINHVI
jgi:hypothetical protein